MSHHFIKFTDVKYKYSDGTEALKGVTFTVTHGERVALLGLNGCGKSTLLLHTNGLLLPTSGEVNVGDVPVTKDTLPEMRRAVGMVFQNPDDMLFMPTVFDDVAFGPRNMKLPEKEVERRAQGALEAVGMFEFYKKASFQLSGGQRRSVAIASVLSMEPNILVLDEPTSNLDIRARRRLIDLLSQFHHTLLIATHDLDLAMELCPRTLLMDDGKIIADGSTESILSDKTILKRVEMLP